jgi:hypothetical protein
MRAREISRGLPIVPGLLTATGPPLLLFEELFRVGRCASRNGTNGKQSESDKAGYDRLHGFLFNSVFPAQ